MDPRVSEYQSQLDQVDALVAADPTNGDLLQIRKDLQIAIELTEKLIQQEKQENREKDDEYDLDSYYDATHKTSDAAEEQPKFEVGERVEVTSGERPFAAVITAIPSDGKEATLRYYEYPDTEVTLSLSSMKSLRGSAVFKDDALAAGMKCQAKYAADQKWYDVTVAALTDCGYRIVYDKFGDTEEVPVEYLRPKLTMPSATTNAAAATTAGKGVSKAADGGLQLIPIPESLKILPTDTEQERERKRKRVKAIKSKNRLAAKEAEVSAVQNTWKTFVTKGTKKSLAGVAKKQKSMFSAPEQVEGRVGVIGSGQGMTHYGARKKHKFNDEDA